MDTNFKVWALADLHLAFSVPEKNMAVFGEIWHNYTDKIEKHWREKVKPQDLVLIAGDITWAMKIDDAKIDLEWIDALPGTKLLIRGNHDYWWSSLNKVKAILPPSIHIIQNNIFNWQEIAIAGTRLWDTNEFSFHEWIDYKETSAVSSAPKQKDVEKDRKIFNRELNRLEISLQQIPIEAKLKIAMLHYPPIGPDLKESKVSQLLEKYNIDICIFGHLHSLKPHLGPLFGDLNGIKYHLTACDYLNFIPLLVYESL